MAFFRVNKKMLILSYLLVDKANRNDLSSWYIVYILITYAVKKNLVLNFETTDKSLIRTGLKYCDFISLNHLNLKKPEKEFLELNEKIDIIVTDKSQYLEFKYLPPPKRVFFFTGTPNNVNITNSKVLNKLQQLAVSGTINLDFLLLTQNKSKRVKCSINLSSKIYETLDNILKIDFNCLKIKCNKA